MEAPQAKAYVADFCTIAVEFRLEVIRPAYVDAQRPDNQQLPTSYPTGGQPFTIDFQDEAAAQSAVVRLIRTGWSTHGLQMGQRSLELQRTVNGKSVTFQQPRDAKLFPPGSALGECKQTTARC